MIILLNLSKTSIKKVFLMVASSLPLSIAGITTMRDANCSKVNIITVTPNNAMSYWAKDGSPGGTSNNIFNSVNFTGTTSNYRTNVRSGASTNSSLVGYINLNTRVSFSGWIYGDAVNDLWTGRPDRRWYRIAGTNYYVSSATINGNAPGSQP
jgi:hypothetical protein